MAIEIKETFIIRAPAEAVWRFLIEPERVVVCMPGAELERIVDERTFQGNVRVKVGPVVVSYSGQAEFAELDEENHRVVVTGHGREKGGVGSAKGSLTSSLTSLGDSSTEVSLVACLDVTGRVMQLGARMMESVSMQLLREFIACVRSTLEQPAADEQALAAVAQGPAQPKAATRSKPIPIVTLLLRTAWQAIEAMFRRVFGRKA